MQIKKIALAVAFAAAAAASASAADIQIYGRVDSGLRYENMSGKDDSLSMTNNKSAPRIGFNIKEDLGNGYMVKVYLENGFKLDTGEFSSATRFSTAAPSLPSRGPGVKSVRVVQAGFSPPPHRTAWASPSLT